MATAVVTEYEELATDANGNVVPIPMEPNVGSQTVTYTTSTASNAFDGRAKFIAIQPAAAAVFVAFGSAPTATAASTYVAANTVRYFGIKTGVTKVACYDGSS